MLNSFIWAAGILLINYTISSKQVSGKRRPHLHATHTHTKRCRGALFAFLHLTGSLFLWRVITMLPGAHLQVQDTGVAKMMDHIFQKQKFLWKFGIKDRNTFTLHCLEHYLFILGTKHKRHKPFSFLSLPSNVKKKCFCTYTHWEIC